MTNALPLNELLNAFIVILTLTFLGAIIAWRRARRRAARCLKVNRKRGPIHIPGYNRYFDSIKRDRWE